MDFVKILTNGFAKVLHSPADLSGRLALRHLLHPFLQPPFIDDDSIPDAERRKIGPVGPRVSCAGTDAQATGRLWYADSQFLIHFSVSPFPCAKCTGRSCFVSKDGQKSGLRNNTLIGYNIGESGVRSCLR